MQMELPMTTRDTQSPIEHLSEAVSAGSVPRGAYCNKGATFLISQLGPQALYLKSKDIYLPPSDLKWWEYENLTQTLTLGYASGPITRLVRIPPLGTPTGATSMESPTASEESPVAGTKTSELGRKADKEKLRWDLLPANEIEDIVGVLTYGANKYSPWNWKYVEDSRDRYFSAAMRHMWLWWKGETHDSETKRSHLSHAICCLLFLMWHESNRSKGLGKVNE